MSFEAAVTAGFVGAYGYVAKQTYDIYKGTSMKRKAVTPERQPSAKRALFDPIARFTTGSQWNYKMAIHAPTLHSRTYRRTAYRNLLGRRVGKYGTRKATINETNTSLAPDRQQYWDPLVYIEWSDNDDIINVRKGRLVNVRGVKIKHIFKLNPDIARTDPIFHKPLRVRWAVVFPKEQPFFPNTISGEPDFFINSNPSTSIATAFPKDTGAHFALFNRKINREKFGVMKEGQFILCNDQGNSNATFASAPTSRGKVTTGTTKIINMYIPINRQMRWGTNQTGSAFANPEENVWFVWWYAQDCELTGSAQKFASGSPPIVDDLEKTTYFRNSQMYM